MRDLRRAALSVDSTVPPLPPLLPPVPSGETVPLSESRLSSAPTLLCRESPDDTRESGPAVRPNDTGELEAEEGAD